MNKEQLQTRIAELKSELKPLEEQLREIHRTEEADIETRIRKANAGHGDFQLDELRFAAYERCVCGAGMAYPKKIGIHGSWNCSNILRGIADVKALHSAELPFVFWEVKSEEQPSANGQTTRPKH